MKTVILSTNTFDETMLRSTLEPSACFFAAINAMRVKEWIVLRRNGNHHRESAQRKITD